MLKDRKKKREKLKVKRELYRTKFESVKRWRDGVCAETSGSPKTEEKHLNYLIKFCEFIKMNPDEIINARIQDLMISDPLVRNRWEDKVKAFNRKLRVENGYYAGREATTSLKSFFMHNHVPLSMKTPKIKDPETYTPSKDEIEKLYRVAKPGWERARTSFTFQSGIRRGSIPHLKYRHIKKDFEAGITPVHIHLSKEEVKGEYFGYDTFIGKQAVEDISLSLELRKRGTRKIPPEVIKDESPLFRKENTRVIEPCDETAFTSWFVALSKRAGVEERITPQALRRATETTLEESNVIPQNWIDHIMGHRPRGAQGKHYSKPTIKKLREAYSKAEPYLTLRLASTTTVTVAVPTADATAETTTSKNDTLETKPLNELAEQEIKHLYEKNQQIQRNLDSYLTSPLIQSQPSVNDNSPTNSDENKKAPSEKAAFSESHAKLSDRHTSKNLGLLYYFKAEPPPVLNKSESKPYQVRLALNKDELVRLLENGWDLLRELSSGEFVVRRRKGCENDG